jgi:hypothetical protein
VILLLAALLSFQPFDLGLPRSGQWRHGFAVADMNRDGLADLAFSPRRKQSGPPVIYLNEGNGRWRQWEEATFPALPFDYGAVAAADFDGNGANDLAIGSHYRGVTVILGDGSGRFIAGGEGMQFPATPRESAPFSSRAVVAVDWNHDGRMDVAALSDGPRPGVSGVQLGVTVFENLGFGWKAVRATTSDRIFGDSIATGDVDGDRVPDLITASETSADSRILRLGAGSELERREVATLLPQAFVHAVDAHDFDADGRDEIVIAYSAANGESIELVSLPDGSRPPRQVWSGTTRVAAVAAGDVNGDGAADIVAALGNGRLLTFRGDGQGFVTPDAEIAVPAWRSGCSPYAIRVADLDGDRRDEIIAVFAGESSGCTSGGGIEVWRTSFGFSKRRAVRR